MTKTAETQTAPKGPISFAALDNETKGETPFAFDLLDDKGKPTGARLLVLSTSSLTVKERIYAIMNARNALVAQREIERKKNPDAVIVDDVREGVELLANLAAARLYGWENVAEPFTEELGKRLCLVNVAAREQVVKNADENANFTPA